MGWIIDQVASSYRNSILTISAVLKQTRERIFSYALKTQTTVFYVVFIFIFEGCRNSKNDFEAKKKSAGDGVSEAKLAQWERVVWDDAVTRSLLRELPVT